MNQAIPIDPKLTIEWLNKLIMMAQWDRKLPFHLVRLLSDPSAYNEFLSRVASGDVEQTGSPVEGTPVTIARKKLLAAVAAVPTLQELFAAEADPFNDAPLDHLQLLAEVSDITVKPPQMIYSRNGTLIAVVDALRQSQQLNTEPLIVDGLNKLLTLIETNERVAEMLFELSQSPHWYIVLASLREDRDYTRDEEPVVAQMLRDWQANLTNPLKELLFRPGHLSRAPKKLIEMAWTQRQVFEEARQSLPDVVRVDPIEERRQVANEALSLFEERAESACDGIEADLKVLATVAQHYLKVRKFAKFDGFVYTWPDIARLAMSNYSALKYVEDILVNRKPRPTDADLDAREARDLYMVCEKNDRLIRFLRLRPYFSEINENELRQYQPLAPVVVTETPQTRDSSPALDLAPPQPTAPPPSTLVQPFVVKLVNMEMGNDGNYTVHFVDPKVGSSDMTVMLPVQKLFDRILGAMGVTSEAILHEVLRELFSSTPTLAESRMARGGRVLGIQALPVRSKEDISKILSGSGRIRLVLNLVPGEVHYLQWEWLTIETSAQVLLTNPDFSLVRANSPHEDISPVALIPPVRILGIFPDPPLGERFSSETTIQALQSTALSEDAQYKALVRSDAKIESFITALKTIRPHIVHVDGYFSSTLPEGVVRFVLSHPDDLTITVEQLGDILRENGVQLLVIGKNNLSRIYDNTGATAAYLLSRKGLPAIIAPMRAIDDSAATIFTTEFYTAFLRGNPLETALYMARRSTASKGGDWSVFALFADPAGLDEFQVLRETA